MNMSDFRFYNHEKGTNSVPKQCLYITECKCVQPPPKGSPAQVARNRQILTSPKQGNWAFWEGLQIGISAGACKPLGPNLCISCSMVSSMKQRLGLETYVRVCMFKGGQPNTNVQTCTQTRHVCRCRRGKIILTLLIHNHTIYVQG